MKNLNNIPKRFMLTSLASSLLLLNFNAYALQAMTEQDLRKIDGQDGVSVTTQYDQINIDQLYMEDNAGTAANVSKALRATADTVKITGINATLKPGSTLKLNTGSNSTSTNAGLDVEFNINPSLTTVNSLKVCDVASTVCGTSFGKLAIESTATNSIKIVTSDGLFNKDSQASLMLGLNNNNLYIGHDITNGGTLNNQLILKSLNFNLAAKGVIYVDDSEGLVLHTNTGGMAITKASLTQAPNGTYGYVDLNRVVNAAATGGTYNNGTNSTTSGLNLEFMTKANVDTTVANPYNTTGAKGLIRVGASGRIVNAYLQVRGVNASGTANPTSSTAGNILGTATTASTTNASGTDTTVMGNTGIGVRLRGEFTKSGDAMLAGDNTKATTLEIGGAGSNTYGFEFSELAPLVVGSTERAYFDSGNVYVNLTDTKQLQMPQNAALNTAKFGANGTVTSAADYTQTINSSATNINPYALVLAIRGMDFQAVSKRGRFTATDTSNATFANDQANGNNWGLGLPIYNLNSNVAISGTRSAAATPIYGLDTNGKVTQTSVSDTQRLGLSLALSTQGVSTDGSKTTSIMIIDAIKNQYIGIRNIDMLLKGTGSIGFENGNLNVTLPDLLIVMAGQVAAGYLPGAGGNAATSFSSNKDVLFGLKLRLQGKMDFSLIPNSSIADGARLSIVGDFDMNQPNTYNTIQISEPTDGSVLGLDNITGLLRFNNAIIIGKDAAGAGKVGFNAEFNFNPKQDAAGVFRVKDINLYPSVNTAGVISTGAPQRLGEMAITGGRLSSQLGIVPRN